MLNKVVRFLLLTEGFAVCTFAAGWWGVPAAAFIWGLAADPRPKSARFAAICASAGWASLLLLDATRGPVGEVATRLGGVMQIPGIVLIGITLLFPGLLAWSASSVGMAIRVAIAARRAQSAAGAESSAGNSGSGNVAVADV